MQGHACPSVQPADEVEAHQPGTRWERIYLGIERPLPPTAVEAAEPAAVGEACEQLELVIALDSPEVGGTYPEEEQEELSELVGGIHREFGPHCRDSVRVHVLAPAADVLPSSGDDLDPSRHAPGHAAASAGKGGRRAESIRSDRFMAEVAAWDLVTWHTVNVTGLRRWGTRGDGAGCGVMGRHLPEWAVRWGLTAAGRRDFVVLSRRARLGRPRPGAMGPIAVQCPDILPEDFPRKA